MTPLVLLVKLLSREKNLVYAKNRFLDMAQFSYCTLVRTNTVNTFASNKNADKILLPHLNATFASA